MGEEFFRIFSIKRFLDRNWIFLEFLFCTDIIANRDLKMNISCFEH